MDNKEKQDKKSSTKLDSGMENLSSFFASKMNDIGNKTDVSINEIIAILCFVSSFVLFLSYASMNPADSSLLSTSFDNSATVRNILGKFGASISALSFSSFGLASYVMPLFFIWTGLNSIVKSNSKTYLSVAGFSAIAMIIASVFLDFILSKSASNFQKGGIIGHVINSKFSSIAGSFGTFLVIVTSSIFAVLFAMKSGVKDSITNIKTFFSELHNRLDKNKNKNTTEQNPKKNNFIFYKNNSKPHKEKVYDVEEEYVPMVDKKEVNPLKFHILPFIEKVKINESINKSDSRAFDFSEDGYQENKNTNGYNPLDKNIFADEDDIASLNRNNNSFNRDADRNADTQREQHNENIMHQHRGNTLNRDITSIIRNKIHIHDDEQPEPQPSYQEQYSVPEPQPSYQEQYSVPEPQPSYQEQYNVPEPQPSYQEQYSVPEPQLSYQEQYNVPEPQPDPTREIKINQYEDYDNNNNNDEYPNNETEEPTHNEELDKIDPNWSMGYAKNRPYKREDHFGYPSPKKENSIDTPKSQECSFEQKEIENTTTTNNNNIDLPKYAEDRTYNREHIEPENNVSDTNTSDKTIKPPYKENIPNNKYGAMTESDLENINMYRRDIEDVNVYVKPTININKSPELPQAVPNYQEQYKPASSELSVNSNIDAIDFDDYINSKIEEADISGFQDGYNYDNKDKNIQIADTDDTNREQQHYREDSYIEQPDKVENIKHIEPSYNIEYQEHINHNEPIYVEREEIGNYGNNNEDNGLGYMEISTANIPTNIDDLDDIIDTIPKPNYQTLEGKKVLKGKKKYDPDEFIQSNFDREYVDENYKRPMLDLLKRSVAVNTDEINEAIKQTAIRLEKTLQDFSVDASVVSVSRGPVITRYELELVAGTRVSKIIGLTDNIALALASESVRIIAPIPGRSVIGIEIPNKVRADVFLRDVLESKDFQQTSKEIPFVIGKGIYGNNVVTDLAEAPHLLVAGTTGSGKSVCLSTIILSFLFKFRPDELKFIFIDKKRVELSIYNGIPHLMAPVVSDEKKATIVLRHIVDIMESRYERMEKFFVRNVKAYNEKINQLIDDGETDFEGEPLEFFPYIVVVIDELHNLMVVSSKEVEDLISRLAGMSRAVGIHLIIATQRPSADVVTGVIKANLPTRIAFQVPNKTNSRIIIDMSGAEQLLGKGDGLFCSTASQVPERVQGSFVTDAEVKGVVDYLSVQMAPMYDANLIASLQKGDSNASNLVEEIMDEELWDDAIDVVMRTGKASASFLQRKLKIGYNRAARIIELMEAQGYVGPENGSKPRDVYISDDGSNR